MRKKLINTSALLEASVRLTLDLTLSALFQIRTSFWVWSVVVAGNPAKLMRVINEQDPSLVCFYYVLLSLGFNSDYSWITKEFFPHVDLADGYKAAITNSIAYTNTTNSLAWRLCTSSLVELWTWICKFCYSWKQDHRFQQQIQRKDKLTQQHEILVCICLPSKAHLYIFPKSCLFKDFDLSRSSQFNMTSSTS